MNNSHFISTFTLAVSLGLGIAPARAADFEFHGGVPNANPRTNTQPNIVVSGFELRVIAEGSDPLENPSGPLTRFGYLDDGAFQAIEPTKTEPDENTYLVLDHNPGGPHANFDYGRHFLFQGHENAGDLAYITRINLDVNNPHRRITLLTPVGDDGKTHFNRIDGSTFDPFTGTLLFTEENGSAGGVIELNVDWGSPAHTLDNVVGRAAYEGVHPDGNGNILLIEDSGGTGVNIDPANPASPKVARNPNSFVYRFVPDNRSHLADGGKLQALQVWIEGVAVTFVPVNSNNPTGDVFSDNQLKLHTPGTNYPVRWITIHDTSVDGTNSFDANAAAKVAGATPFKRPENAQYLPGSGFRTFFFVPTGDTDARSGNTPALAARGAWGSIFRVDLPNDVEFGTISVVFVGDAVHSSFDNVAFADRRILLATEDRGDNLHRQLNRLDSIWAFDITGAHEPFRFLALGRDPSSFFDANLLDAATPGFQNEGDNEPTGLHVSNGNSTVRGLLGRNADSDNARVFFTQQHGDNTVFEIVGDEGH